MKVFLGLFKRGAVATLAFLGLLLSCDGPSNPPPPPDPGSVRLVVCPTNETLTTQALMNPLRLGTVSLAGTVVAVPVGALQLPTLIRLTIPASQFMEIEVTANDLTSFLFQDEIGIRIDYSRCTDPDLAWARLSVWEIDPVTKALIEFKGGVDDKANRTISFKTNHLSGYAIAF